MADCRDWLIIQALMNQLRLITYDNLYNTNINHVMVPKAELDISEEQLPVILVFYNENTLDQEGLSIEDSDLDITIVYTDGKCDKNEQESYIERYRNVGADIRKCLMANPSLGGLCEYIQIIRNLSTLLPINTGVIEANISMLKIKRTLNHNDPYL